VFQIKNLMSQPIAGLKIEEFWYDKANNRYQGPAKLFGSPFSPTKW
jgi:hypothetical protein